MWKGYAADLPGQPRLAALRIADADYASFTADFGPGAMLVLYSDILTDCVDEHRNRSGKSGAFERISDCATAPTAEALVAAVCAPFLDAPTGPLIDDLTVVCIMRTRRSRAVARRPGSRPRG